MKNTKYWIALEQSRGIGPANLKIIYDALRSKNLSITDIFDLAPDEISGEFPFNGKIIEAIIDAKNSLPMIEEEYFYLLDAGIETITFFEEAYPDRLKDVLGSNYPPILYVYGDKGILNQKGAAILGEAGVSEKGKEISYLAAKELANRRIAVISGFAGGVGQIAHTSAIENGGSTIAFLPYGLKNLKIPEAMQKIPTLDKLLLVSSFFPTIEYSKYNAFARNRLICALSQAVYIVESPGESGIFEAGKSAKKLEIPLFVTEYTKYPEGASGNKILIEEYGADTIKGKMTGNVLTPNLDKLVGIVKFNST